MDALRFKQIKFSLQLLTRAQKQRLLAIVKDDLAAEQSFNAVEALGDAIKCCPHCSHERWCRWGVSDGLQRYRCKSCLKTFNALTKSPLSRLRHKQEWMVFSTCLREGCSVRKSAALCGIDASTAFRWRHRFLQIPAQKKADNLTGIVEADETFFTESCKGNRQLTHRPPRKRGVSSKKRKGHRVPVLIVRDRSGSVADFIFDVVRKEEFHAALKACIDREATLCSDGNSIYTTFARDENIPHKRVIGIRQVRVIDKIFHIQNLNAYMGRLKSWMTRFNGVSTKYLENYLGWRRLLEKKGDTTEFYLRAAMGFCANS
jgi:transposase-like protein